MRRSSSGRSRPPLTLPISMSVWPDRRCRVTAKPVSRNMKSVHCSRSAALRRDAVSAGGKLEPHQPSTEALHRRTGSIGRQGDRAGRPGQLVPPIRQHRLHRRLVGVRAAASRRSPHTAAAARRGRGPPRPSRYGTARPGRAGTPGRSRCRRRRCGAGTGTAAGRHRSGAPAGPARPAPGTGRTAVEDRRRRAEARRAPARPMGRCRRSVSARRGAGAWCTSWRSWPSDHAKVVRQISCRRTISSKLRLSACGSSGPR